VDLVAILALQALSAMASLVLISLGLAVVFGMMRVINLAHGEFLMLGGYAAVTATARGVDPWIAMLVLAPLVAAAVGVVVERLLIRRLYGRRIGTLLATWGLSLFLVGLVTAIFGNTTTTQMAPPFGSLRVGAYGIGGYELFLIAVAAALLAALFVLLRFTRFGLVARGTMQDAETAAALGLDPGRVYMATFALGAGLAGLAGGLLAPMTAVLPNMGAAYIAKAFITVISGGAAILSGTAAAAALLGVVNTAAAYMWTPVIGEVALLAVALVLLRVLPRGITGGAGRGAP